MTKTTLANEATHNAAMNSWRVVDAEGKPLGRMATEIATILMGKHRPDYTPHILVGEGVIVINAEKVATTGTKDLTREYTRYTHHPGGLVRTTLGEMRQHDPQQLITLAVRRMLPKNRLAKRMIERLKVYRGATHPHVAQKPKDL